MQKKYIYIYIYHFYCGFKLELVTTLHLEFVDNLWGPFLVGLGCLLRWWALVFLSKGAGAGPIATQLGPVCAQTYATPARSKFFGKQNRSKQATTG